MLDRIGFLNPLLPAESNVMLADKIMQEGKLRQVEGMSGRKLLCAKTYHWLISLNFAYADRQLLSMFSSKDFFPALPGDFASNPLHTRYVLLN